MSSYFQNEGRSNYSHWSHTANASIWHAIHFFMFKYSEIKTHKHTLPSAMLQSLLSVALGGLLLHTLYTKRKAAWIIEGQRSRMKMESEQGTCAWRNETQRGWVEINGDRKWEVEGGKHEDWLGRSRQNKEKHASVEMPEEAEKRQRQESGGGK